MLEEQRRRSALCLCLGCGDRMGHDWRVVRRESCAFADAKSTDIEMQDKVYLRRPASPKEAALVRGC